MTDEQILTLFFDRDEQALQVTEAQYGAYCRCVAGQILRRREDVQECVNETWLRAWQAIPPRRPGHLKMYLASITRNLAYNMHRYDTAKRRGGEHVDVALEELAECIPAGEGPEETWIARELGESVNRFLDTLPERDRNVFLRRYFFVESNRQIARQYGMREGNVAVILSRVRKQLREHLTKEGYIHDKP